MSGAASWPWNPPKVPMVGDLLGMAKADPGVYAGVLMFVL